MAGLNDVGEEGESTVNYTGRMWDGIEKNKVRRERISEWLRLAKLVPTIPFGSSFSHTDFPNRRAFALFKKPQ